MPTAYRIYFFRHGLKRDSDVVWAEDDADAVRKAKEQFKALDLEIWEGQRIVAKLELDDP